MVIHNLKRQITERDYFIYDVIEPLEVMHRDMKRVISTTETALLGAGVLSGNRHLVIFCTGIEKKRNVEQILVRQYMTLPERVAHQKVLILSLVFTEFDRREKSTVESYDSTLPSPGP